MIGSVGPNVSSVIAFIEWSTSASTVGSKKRPGALADVAAGGDAGARLARLLDVAADDVELRART